MKRPHSAEPEGVDGERVTKRLRSIEDIFSDDALMNVHELLPHIGTTLDSGFLRCRVKMKWPWIKAKHRAILQCYTPDYLVEPKHSISVCFTGDCAEFRDKLTLVIGDELCLSLEGAKIEKNETKESTLPMNLVYENGVSIHLLRRKGIEQAILLDTRKHDEDVDESGPKQISSAPNLDKHGLNDPPHQTSFTPVHDTTSRQDVVESQSTEQEVALSKEPADPSFVTEIIPPHSSFPVAADTSEHVSIYTDPPCESIMTRPQPEIPREVSVPAAPMSTGVALSVVSSSHDHLATVFDSSKHEPSSSNAPVKESKRQMKRRLKEERKAQRERVVTEATGHNAPAIASSVNESGPIGANSTEEASSVPQSLAILQGRHNSENIFPYDIPSDVNLFSANAQSNPSNAEKTQHEISPPVAIMHQIGEDSIGQPTAYPEHRRFIEISQLSEVSNQHFNIIGVVARLGNIRSIKRDVEGRGGNDDTIQERDQFSLSIRLIDQSNFHPKDFNLARVGVSVNCFSPRYEGWLPRVSEGSVIALHAMKRSQFGDGGSNIVGYSGTYKWVVYDPQLKAFQEPPVNIPRKDFLKGESEMYSPFWDPDHDVRQEVIDRCDSVAKWWADLQSEIQATRGTVHQIAGNTGSVGSAGRPVRQHHLIKDVTTTTEPNGYFDCTIELLHSHKNDNGSYSLYVTDYTEVQGTSWIRGSWCRAELRKHVLRIECWDHAVHNASTWQNGQYIAMQNVRMKLSNYGYIEGKWVEGKKADVLDVSDAESRPELAALLRRKEEWQSDNSIWKKFPHRLVSDIDSDTFAHFTVDVLHIDQSDEKCPIVFVTDYTSNVLLQPIPVKFTRETWAAGLEYRILQVAMPGEQQEHAEVFRKGCTYLFRNLRSVNRERSQTGWIGEWNGKERFFDFIGRNKDGEHIDALRRRRDEWKARAKEGPPRSGPDESSNIPVGIPNGLTKVSARHGPPPLKEIIPNAPHYSIDDAQAFSCPSKFRLRARVVDYYPLRLEECAVMQCDSCFTILGKAQKLCSKCNILDDTSAQWRFHFFLRVADEAGSELDVFVGGKENALIKDLDPNFDDPEAIQCFKQRMTPLLANLEAVHDGIASNTSESKVDAPLAEFVLYCWSPPEEKSGDNSNGRIYELMDVARLRG